MWSWLGTVFDGIYRGLEMIGDIVFGFGEAIVVLVTHAGQILGLLVQILWQTGNVAASMVTGLLSTLRSISSPAYGWGAASRGVTEFSTAVPLAAIGWLLAGLVWLIIAVSVVQLVSKRG